MSWRWPHTCIVLNYQETKSMEDTLKRSTMKSLCLFLFGTLLIIAFQNCSRVGFQQADIASLKTGDGRDPGVDPNSIDDRESGEDPTGKDDDRDPGDDDDSDWLYIPGGRGHVPMSSVAVCPTGSKDAGKKKCPFFCYKGMDYLMHKSLARDYFAKKFDEQANYGGGAVPGTCANPDLKIKD